MELLLHLCVHGQSRKSSLILRKQQIFQSSTDEDQCPEKHRRAGWVCKKAWECLITLFWISSTIFYFVHVENRLWLETMSGI